MNLLHWQTLAVLKDCGADEALQRKTEISLQNGSLGPIIDRFSAYSAMQIRQVLERAPDDEEKEVIQNFLEIRLCIDEFAERMAKPKRRRKR